MWRTDTAQRRRYEATPAAIKYQTLRAACSGIQKALSKSLGMKGGECAERFDAAASCIGLRLQRYSRNSPAFPGNLGTCHSRSRRPTKVTPLARPNLYCDWRL